MLPKLQRPNNYCEQLPKKYLTFTLRDLVINISILYLDFRKIGNIVMLDIKQI